MHRPTTHPVPPFTLRQLHMFVTVASEESFSAAARSLNKAQSAVSTAIANLEIDLDARLFERYGRELVLTEAGEQLLAQAQSVLMRCLTLEEHAYAFSEQTETELELALDNAVPLSSIAPVLRQWQEDYPTVSLHLTQPNMEAVPRLLRDNEVDLALMLVQSDYPKEIAFCRLGQLRMVEVAHVDHPLVQKCDADFADLSDYCQLVFHPHGRAIATSEYVISPRHYVVEGYLPLLEMLRQGLGWAMVPYNVVVDDIRAGKLREIELKAYPFTDWIVGVDLLWCRTQHLGRAANDLKVRLRATQVHDFD